MTPWVKHILVLYWGCKGHTDHLRMRLIYQSCFNCCGQDVWIMLGLKPIYKVNATWAPSLINKHECFKCKNLVFYNPLQEFFIIKETHLLKVTRKPCSWRKTMAGIERLSLQGSFWATLGKNFLQMKFFLVFQFLHIKHTLQCTVNWAQHICPHACPHNQASDHPCRPHS